MGSSGSASRLGVRPVFLVVEGEDPSLSTSQDGQTGNAMWWKCPVAGHLLLIRDGP